MMDTNVESITASRATAGRSYRLNCIPKADTLDLSVNLSNYTTRNIDCFFSGLLPVDIVKQHLRQTRSSILQTWKSGNIDQAVSLFDDCDGLWQNAV